MTGPATVELTTCPECRAPAEITDRFVLESTAGPLDHAKVQCVRRHWFLLSIESLDLANRRLRRAAR